MIHYSNPLSKILEILDTCKEYWRSAPGADTVIRGEPTRNFLSISQSSPQCFCGEQFITGAPLLQCSPLNVSALAPPAPHTSLYPCTPCTTHIFITYWRIFIAKKRETQGCIFQKIEDLEEKLFSKVGGGMIFLEIYILGDWGDILTEKLIRSFFHCKKVEN